MADRETGVPLTDVQRHVLALVARHRSPDSYLAGGAALHLEPHSTRFSDDLDFFHDSVERVATAYRDDEQALRAAGYEILLELSQPGFIRAIVQKGGDATRIDWAHDSAWRFLPPVRDAIGGFTLHPIDLAINKTLALAGRDEPRDFVDILALHEQVLPLGGLVWAAVGKDPGFSPLSLLELLKRRGRYRVEDFRRLQLVEPFDLQLAKGRWQAALDSAERLVASRPAAEAGCLYYAAARDRFELPGPDASLEHQGLIPHFGTAGGVLPQPGPPG